MIISPKIELRQTRNMGKGFFALEDIKIGEQIMSIDVQNFISCERFKQFFEFSEILCSSQISNKTLFAYFMATVRATPKNHPQQYKDILNYIAQLPKQLQGLMNWSLQQLDLIENRQLVEKVKQKVKQIKKQFNIIRQNVERMSKFQLQNWQYRLFNNVKQIQLVTFQDMKYFYSVIQSRSVHDPCFLDVGALAPYLQLFNHSVTPHCKVQCNYKNTVYTITKIRKNQQIFVSYGQNNNENFLELYGFLPHLQQIIGEDEHYREKITLQYNKIYRDEMKNLKLQQPITKQVDYNDYN